MVPYTKDGIEAGKQCFGVFFSHGKDGKLGFRCEHLNEKANNIGIS